MKKTHLDAIATPRTPPPQYPIESVDNALKVLLLLGERPQLRLTEVSEFLGVASSTAHRLLAMLQYRGFVVQDSTTKAYAPGTALTSVAYSILQRFDFRRALHPYLERLNEHLRETVHLVLLDGGTVRFIDAIESPRAVRVGSRLGRSMPASSSSSGKAMLAQLSTEELHALYPGQELEPLTEHSIRTRDDLERELDEVRRRGYAVSVEESEADVTAVSVAFPPQTSHPPLVFNAAVPSGRVSASRKREIGLALRAMVDEAAARLHD
ncbi:IclR family transcriptional regulator [Streptomyces justiciae]|uniref:IclR family transcriptional regulator n=1 Tax=Streptomyces justiciae TaxID=2780140 RepID=UPI0021198253|nr:IclR family transcriptional regulator [Streptomyces justiciae]MCW8379722.1 IclR family transcriptional regulator [Streptomyces justiciae]